MVSIVTSVGNMAYEMKVKGHNILRFPFASIEDYKSRPPSRHGIPLLAPWGNRLDEQAFYANGKRYAFDMSLGNITGAVPIHGFMSLTDQWQIVELKHDGTAAWLTSRLDVYKQPAWMKQWPFAHTIEMTYRLAGGVLEVRTKVVNMSAEPMPVALGYHPWLQLTDSPRDEWTITVPARTRWLLELAEGADGRDGADRRVLHELQGRAQGLQHRRCVHGPGAGCAGARDGDAEGPHAANRGDAGPELQGDDRLLAEPAGHGARKPDSAAESESARGAAPARPRTACASSPAAEPAGDAELHLHRTDGGHHQRA